MAAGHIAPADVALLGDLPLGLGALTGEAVAQADDQVLPGGETAVHQGPDFLAGLLDVQVLQHGVVHPDDVHQGEVVALAVVFQRVGQRHLSL